MQTKYIAQATRWNPGKVDYEWTHKYTNGTPIHYDNLADAMLAAKSACANDHSMYDPRVKEVEV